MRSGNQKSRSTETLLAYESNFWSRGHSVAGVDEAGRGPLAGPVLAAAAKSSCMMLSITFYLPENTELLLLSTIQEILRLFCKKNVE